MKLLATQDIKAVLESVRQCNPGRVCAATVNDVWCQVEPDLWAALVRRLEDGRLVLLEPGEPTQTVTDANFQAAILPLCLDTPSAHEIPQDIQDLFRALLGDAKKAQAELAQAEQEFANTLDTLAKPEGTKKMVQLGDLYEAVDGLTDCDEIQDLLRNYGYDAKGVRNIAAILKERFAPHHDRLSKAGFEHEWLAYYLPYWTLQAVKRQQVDPGKN